MKLKMNLLNKKRCARTAVLSALLGGVLALLPAPAAAQSFLYVVTENTVGTYKIDPGTGMLTNVSWSPWNSQVSPNSIVADPKGRFAYVSYQSGPVSAYTINASTGVLQPVAVPQTATQVSAVDPTGKFAYDLNGLKTYTIDQSTGSLNLVPGLPIAEPTQPFQLEWLPNTAFAYVLGGQFANYTINASGVLSPYTPPTPYPLGPFIVDPAGKFAYTPWGGTGATGVAAYAINPANGTLTSMPGYGYTNSSINGDTYMVVAPSGKFAYLIADDQFTSFHGEMLAFSISSGALTQIGPSVQIGSYPTSIAMDATGSFLYVYTKGWNDIADPSDSITAGLTVYKIDSTGAPTPIQAVQFAPGSAGSFITVNIPPPPPPPAMGISVEFSPTEVTAGGHNYPSLFITLNNPFGFPVTGAKFTDTMTSDPGLPLASAEGGLVSSSCTGATPSTLTAGATAFSFSGIGIPAHSSCTVSFRLHSLGVPGQYYSKASGVTTDQTPAPGPVSNTAVLTVDPGIPICNPTQHTCS
jgi:6-phosphogluconolactonase (cycloisomerase 2 family)